MDNRKKIMIILGLLLLAAIGCGLAAWLLPVGKFRGLLIRFSILAFLAVLVFSAGLVKGR